MLQIGTTILTTYYFNTNTILLKACTTNLNFLKALAVLCQRMRWRVYKTLGISITYSKTFPIVELLHLLCQPSV